MLTDKEEKVVVAAAGVFLRHGFRRVTMGQIADAAAMSRPALYLVFDSKEAVFRAALDRHFEATLAGVRAALATGDALHPRLMAALELWCVRPFEMTLAAPEAKDLLESGYTVADEMVRARFDAFERLLAQSIKPHVGAGGRVALSAVQIARIVVAAAVGFKQSATTAARLRQMISGLLTMVLASLDA